MALIFLSTAIKIINSLYKSKGPILKGFLNACHLPISKLGSDSKHF